MISMKKTFVLTLLASSLFLASCASDSRPKRGPGGGGERFAALDTSGDGSINYSEFQQGPMAKRGGDAQAAFNRLDSNSDGSLSKEEMRAGAKGKRPRPTS